jgi:hypothetical protein
MPNVSYTRPFGGNYPEKVESLNFNFSLIFSKQQTFIKVKKQEDGVFPAFCLPPPVNVVL